MVVRRILLYGGETWPLRAADERRLEVFDNNCPLRTLRHRRTDGVTWADLRRSRQPDEIPSTLLQRQLRWRRADDTRSAGGETPYWFAEKMRRTGKIWDSNSQENLTILFAPTVLGLCCWNRDRMAIACELTDNCRIRAALRQGHLVGQTGDQHN